MLALPEMFLTGYQAQDLVQKPAFVADAQAKLAAFRRGLRGRPSHRYRRATSCAMARSGLQLLMPFCRSGKITTQIRKHHLPNYKVFDEERHVRPRRHPRPLCGQRRAHRFPHLRRRLVPRRLRNPRRNGRGNPRLPQRFPLLPRQIRQTHHPTWCPALIESRIANGLYLNLIGGQDDQVFDGGSFVTQHQGGALAMQMPLFDEHIETITFNRTHTQAGWQSRAPRPASLMIGNRITTSWFWRLRDYMRKNRV